MVKDIDDFNTYINETIQDVEIKIHRLKKHLSDIVKSTFLRWGLNAVHMQKSDSVITLVTEEDFVSLDFFSINAEISKTLSSYYENLTISIGVGLR